MFVGSTVKATDSGALNCEFEYGRRKAIITFVFFYSWTNRWHYRRGHLFAGCYRGSSNSISNSISISV